MATGITGDGTPLEQLEYGTVGTSGSMNQRMAMVTGTTEDGTLLELLESVRVGTSRDMNLCIASGKTGEETEHWNY